MTDLTAAEEEDWCEERRVAVEAYLVGEGVTHGGVGEWPAWHLAPFVSVWAVESPKNPGSVGWWAISGDLPGDYCSSATCPHPRMAVRRIAQRWLDGLASTAAGAETIGETGLPAHLAPLLRSRAELLLKWADDPALWPQDVYGS
jgi:hypothetical protein